MEFGALAKEFGLWAAAAVCLAAFIGFLVKWLLNKITALGKELDKRSTEALAREIRLSDEAKEERLRMAAEAKADRDDFTACRRGILQKVEETHTTLIAEMRNQTQVMRETKEVLKTSQLLLSQLNRSTTDGTQVAQRLIHDVLGAHKLEEHT